MMMVSVPYRGATFLNRWLTSLIKVFVIHVSVPYRGATFLNADVMIVDYDNQGFRPLSGSYISQSYCNNWSNRCLNSFRPLSGSYISQCTRGLTEQMLKSGFRPLSGSYISQ